MMLKTLMLILLSLTMVSGFAQLKSKSSKTHPPISAPKPKQEAGKRTISITGQDIRDTSEIQIMYIVQENGDTTSYLGAPGYEVHNWFIADGANQASDAGVAVYSHEWVPLVQFKDYVMYYKKPKPTK